MDNLIHADCLDAMAAMDAETIDAICTDPPYGLSFMGKNWDHGVPGVPFWAEMWRIAKPGAHLLAFGGTRTVHRLAAAIEDAGWEIRDMLVWGYASGFPKSLDVSKAIDRAAGAERDIPGRHGVGPEGIKIAGNDGLCVTCGKQRGSQLGNCRCDKIGTPVTPDAEKWNGWGTALKPAWEPIVMARKPLRGTVAASVLKYGTGALNIDGTRIAGAPRTTHADGDHRQRLTSKGAPGGAWGNADADMGPSSLLYASRAGRWPANIILTDPIFDGGIEGVVGGGETNGGGQTQGLFASRSAFGGGVVSADYPDSGTYSRFFLIPKSARVEREPVLGGLAVGFAATMNNGIGGREHDPADTRAYRQNIHPTVKPLDLMRHLVRLVTPPGGTVLDPFLGSGTTALAAEMEGFAWIGIEKEAEYVAITEARLNGTQKGLGLVG